MGIYLKETIETAGVIRREIREERKQRDSLWAKLVAELGNDEGAAFSRYSDYQKARKENGIKMEGGDEELVKQMGDQLLEDLYDKDILIRQLKQQHVKLNEIVSRLL
jgi:ABC-type enterochelin transport system ATPase subunit